MKKLQNYLTKPEQIRKKVENPSHIHHDFLQWSKSHLHAGYRPSRSPRQIPSKNELNQRHPRTRSKQNIRPNTSSLLTKKTCRNDHNSQQKSKPIKSNHAKSYSNFGSVRHSRSVGDGVSMSMRDRSKNVSMSSAKGRDSSLQKMKGKKIAESSKKQLKMEFTYSYRTKQGVLASNPSKPNQDRLLIKTKLNNQQSHLFAVADGHGTHGHLVSQFIVTNMANLTETQLQSKKPQQALPTVFDKIQQSLCDSDINASCSGSTLVSVVLEPRYITCANTGDSRAILARQMDKKSWEMIYLSQDHKPGLEVEKRRILKNGGRIHALKDERGQPIGPLRVWLPNQNIQGLAMSRSIGDNVSKPIGVTSSPEIIKIATDPRDRFILLASDEVLQLIVPYYRQNKLEEACDALLKLAYERWTVEDTTVIDDITFVLVFLNHF